jgi:type II secretory pathway predicted ATPase ExeA
MNGPGGLTHRDRADEFALPSRGAAISALRAALELRAGPVLLTGEAGVGKTWLWRRLEAEMPGSWRWVVVDVPPAIEPSTLYLLIGHGFGLPDRGIREGTRMALSDFLREASAEGIHWSLVLDEAHNGSAALLEEVRLLANRLGRPDGLSGLILVGQTSLACRLATRPLNALAARLAAHVQLRGLDVDEARSLLNGLAPGLVVDDRTLERAHRDAAGNPRKMLLASRADAVAATPARQLAEPTHVGSAPSLGTAPPQPSPPADTRPAPTSAASRVEEWETPVIGPVKPPLLVGDGMIEVGWEPEHGPAGEPAFAVASAPVRKPGPVFESTPEPAPERAELLADIAPEAASGSASDPEVEAVEDHYAALQAWNEWSKNQGRTPSSAPPDASVAGAPADQADRTRDERQAPHVQGTNTPAGVWIEGEQGFAPYSQLFSRLRQIRDASDTN